MKHPAEEPELLDIRLSLPRNELEIMLSALHNEAARIRAYRPDGRQDVLKRIAAALEEFLLR